MVAEVNPIKRGWETYFRTGNAANTFNEIDRYVAWRLIRLMITRKGRNLRAGEPTAGHATGSRGWVSTGSWAPSATQGFHRYARKIIGKPCAGKRHARIETGMGKRGRAVGGAPLTTNAERALETLLRGPR
jgi:hypothetical protein